MTKCNAVISTVGRGTWIHLELYKILHQVCGKIMVEHALTQLEKVKTDNTITIVGFGVEIIEQRLGHHTGYVLQEQ